MSLTILGGGRMRKVKVRPNPNLFKSDDLFRPARVLFKAGFSFEQVAVLLSEPEELVCEAIREAL